MTSPNPSWPARGHLLAHAGALVELEAQAARLEGWGEELGRELLAGRRLLAAGNGGSAAQVCNTHTPQANATSMRPGSERIDPRAKRNA